MHCQTSDWGECSSDCRLKSYLSNDQVEKELASLEVLGGGDLARTYVIGETVLGRNITVVKLAGQVGRVR